SSSAHLRVCVSDPCLARLALRWLFHTSLFFFHYSPVPRALPSFPTRRSSDLRRRAPTAPPPPRRRRSPPWATSRRHHSSWPSSPSGCAPASPASQCCGGSRNRASTP